jgi:hypothetical protein
VDLDAPVPVVVPSIFGISTEAPRPGHALGVDAILENTLVQDHGAHGLGAAARDGPQPARDKTGSLALAPPTTRPPQNDPHNLRRLRRPTGPQRTAMR